MLEVLFQTFFANFISHDKVENFSVEQIIALYFTY